MEIIQSQFNSIFTTTKDKEGWCEALNNQLQDSTINTPLRLAHFCAQIAHESACLNTVTENLNYSQSALRSVFKKYFATDAIAAQYARQPEKIANRVYADRMGNGNEASGDGWKYRGRGVIQLTGKNNYTSFFNSIGSDIDPDYLATKDGAIKSAMWFWNNNNLNSYADKDDITTVTKRINGGTNGLDDRKKYLSLAKKALGI